MWSDTPALAGALPADWVQTDQSRSGKAIALACEVDGHVHFWRLSRGDYDWITPKLGPLFTDFEPSDLEPELAACGIDQVIAVQAAPSMDETRHLLSLSDSYKFIAAVVGWAQLESRGAAINIATLARNPKLKGIRAMYQQSRIHGWLTDSKLTPAFACMRELGLCFDALCRTENIEELAILGHRHPDLKIVLNHAAKPDIASGELNSWRENMREISRLENVFCKVSGLATQASVATAVEELEPIIAHLYMCFGEDRLIWGSDWPVIKSRLEYCDWHAMSQVLFEKFPTATQDRIFGSNAGKVYGL
ncbi:MAG: amidohydrolase family protein [Sphingobium sp.]|jgi:L-fuconolactonase|nr:amidohydrolase family protein [Sphingobium sp.]